MTDTRTPTTRSGLVTGARWLLALLAGLFTLGALGQFFLVGLSTFDDPTRWSDHKTLGHILGLVPYILWIPAVLGRTGVRLILATVLLYVLFMAQYAFINVESTVANAFHPLNGAVLLMLGFWIAQRALAAAREPARQSRPRPAREHSGASMGVGERTAS